MRIPTYTKSLRKAGGKTYLLGGILLLVGVIGTLTFTHQTYEALKGLQNEISKLKETKISKFQQEHHVIKKRSQEDISPTLAPNIGVTYVRWGRSDCPLKEDTSIVYHGYVGGSYYSHVGGGSNYICLHHNVTYTPGKYIDGTQGSTWVYGVEYVEGAWSSSLFDMSLIEEGSMLHQGVPCAVCLVRYSTIQLMIPSRETCPSGWTIEYVGYLMTGAHSTKHSSTYVCVDEKPQVIPGSKGAQHGGHFYIVEMDCGYNIPCEPYVDGREVRCVVCTYGN